MKIGRIIKKIITMLFVVFFAAIIIRIFMLTDSRTLSDIYPTDSAAASYKRSGEAAFLTHRTADEISDDGYFGAYALCYDSDSGEMQITVRYNDSLYEKYLSGSDPDKFAWELRDGDKNTVAVGKVLEGTEKYQYNYARLAFDGVEIGEDTRIYMFLICEERDYPDADTEGFCVHRPGQQFKAYKLSGDEKKALEK